MPWSYVAVVPVKPPASGKSRIVGLSDDSRRSLAEAFALDTVTSALAVDAVREVLVATDDEVLTRRFAAMGCATLPDGEAADLNGTLRQAAVEARRRWPALVPVALCADLPALRPRDLAAALAHRGPSAARFVTDAEGTGTTLYTAPYDDFAPHFGVGSRAAHLSTGALEVAGGLPSLRQDVDDLTDLRAAVALGVGERTRAVVDGLGLV